MANDSRSKEASTAVDVVNVNTAENGCGFLSQGDEFTPVRARGAEGAGWQGFAGRRLSREEWV